MSAAEWAAAGAAYLDDHDPGWHDRIDLDRLALVSCSRCVFGQLYGSYDAGEQVLVRADLDPISLGFAALPGDPEAYFQLDEHWAREITSRRLSAAMHSDLAHGAELRAAKRIGRAVAWFGSEGDR